MTTIVPGPTALPKRRGAMRRLLQARAGVISIAFLVALVLVAALAPWLAPHDPAQQSLGNQLQGPSWDHWLGTDGVGRDVLSRIVHAARVALLAPAISVGIAVVLGVPSGLVAGYWRGRVDQLMSILADTLLSIPPIVLAVSIVAVMGPGLTTVMAAVGIVYAPRLFRVVRAATLSAREELYIESANSIGCSSGRILLSHVLPNVASPLLVQVTLLMGFALIAEASLSFLGLGVQLPDASWGSMLRAAYDDKFRAPYAVVPPGVALTLTVLAFNTLGDALRDAVTARRRQ